jgi:hypothetical protein
MTGYVTIEFLARYRRWQRYAWLRWSWWQRRARDNAKFFECSFCKSHTPKDSPLQGVLGVDDYICPDCIALCAQAVGEQDSQWRDRLIEALHKADEAR